MEKREKISKTITALFILLFIFTLLQFISPLILETNTVTDLTGTVGVIDNKQRINTMSFPINAIYTAGDRLCHQKTERSFILNENQMPFCSRCTAIWMGMTIGIGILVFYTISLDNRFLILAIVSLIPIGIDGTGQLLGFWESSHLSRVITGSFIGIITGMALGIIIDELKTLKKSEN
ncbi:MAG: DUF2085 domain-containing protein [Thermoplasmatota archaeon]